MYFFMVALWIPKREKWSRSDHIDDVPGLTKPPPSTQRAGAFHFPPPNRRPMTEAPSGTLNRPAPWNQHRHPRGASQDADHSTHPAAIYVKEAAGYPDGENSRALQTSECENFCLAQGFNITARYYDPTGSRRQFDWMMGETTDDEPSFDVIVVYKLRNFSWSLDETVLCRARLKAKRVTLLSTAEISM